MNNALLQYDTDVLCSLYKSQHALVNLTRKCVRSCRDHGDAEGMDRYYDLLVERSGDLLRIGVALLEKNPTWDHNNLTDVAHHHAL